MREITDGFETALGEKYIDSASWAAVLQSEVSDRDDLSDTVGVYGWSANPAMRSCPVQPAVAEAPNFPFTEYLGCRRATRRRTAGRPVMGQSPHLAVK